MIFTPWLFRDASILSLGLKAPMVIVVVGSISSIVLPDNLHLILLILLPKSDLIVFDNFELLYDSYLFLRQ